VSYVDVPAEAILTFLRERGFARRPTRGAELVYERAHERDPRYRVLVYTSVREGTHIARGRGKDAIRVCAIFDAGGSTRGVAKLPRVHRTGSVEGVLGRVLARMREAYARCSRELPRTGNPRR
jgi:hypothetical protein